MSSHPSACSPLSFLELRVPPLLLTFSTAVAMIGTARLCPAYGRTFPGQVPAAIALLVLGAGIALAGIASFRRNRTTVNPMTPEASSAIVTTGSYRISRNPMYLGFLLTLAGLALYLGNAVAALFLPAFVGYMNRFQIRPEEKALLDRFGVPFSRYLVQVRRWI